MKLKSARLYLRTLTIEDASDTYLSWLKSDVSHFISNRQSNEAALKKYITEQNALDNVHLLGIFTHNGQHIGNIKFIVTPYENGTNAEMGILIGEKAWHGKGVAKEAIFSFVEYAQHHLNLKRISLGVEKDNKPAVKAYLNMGFVPFNQAELEDPAVAGVEMALLLN